MPVVWKFGKRCLPLQSQKWRGGVLSGRTPGVYWALLVRLLGGAIFFTLGFCWNGNLSYLCKTSPNFRGLCVGSFFEGLALEIGKRVIIDILRRKDFYIDK